MSSPTLVRRASIRGAALQYSARFRPAYAGQMEARLPPRPPSTKDRRLRVQLGRCANADGSPGQRTEDVRESTTSPHATYTLFRQERSRSPSSLEEPLPPETCAPHHGWRFHEPDGRRSRTHQDEFCRVPADTIR